VTTVRVSQMSIMIDLGNDSGMKVGVARKIWIFISFTTGLLGASTMVYIAWIHHAYNELGNLATGEIDYWYIFVLGFSWFLVFSVVMLVAGIVLIELVRKIFGFVKSRGKA